MQQFARVLENGRAVPVIIRDGEHLDLRPLVADITPEAIASGVLDHVDTSALKPLSGEFTYLAPSRASGRSRRPASTTGSTSRSSR